MKKLILFIFIALSFCSIAQDRTYSVSRQFTDSVTVDSIFIQAGKTTKGGCENLSDDGILVLPDATKQSLLVWVDGDDEEARVSIQADGTCTIAWSVGSVANTDSDTNLCIFDNGTGAVIKNRLGSAKDVCYETKYK